MSTPTPPGTPRNDTGAHTTTRSAYGSFSDAFVENHLNGHPLGMSDVNISGKDSFSIPCQRWMRIYRREWLIRDAVAALSIASLYIPLSFSFAALAGVHPSSSLYAFVFQPLAYALLGTCPQMVIGPEATCSLLVGSIVSPNNAHRKADTSLWQSKMSGLVSFVAGVLLLTSGILRLGFLERALNRPLMKGFISGVGLVLVIDQAVTALDLQALLNDGKHSQASTATKFIFVVTHLPQARLLSVLFCGVSLSCILTLRSLQRNYRNTFPWLTYIPDRLILIILSIIPYAGTQLAGQRNVLPASLLSALLGFFESSVTSQSLRPPTPIREATKVDATLELVALGSSNVIGGCFSTLPAFGGFGRSQLNAQTGGLTPVSSVFLAILALGCSFFVSSWLEFVPKATLAAMSMAVGIAMIEECWEDVHFFAMIRAYRELGLLLAVLLGIVCHSMTAGITIGIIMTAYQLVLNSTRSAARTSEQPIQYGGDSTYIESMTRSRMMKALGFHIVVPDAMITFSNYHDLFTVVRGCLLDKGESMDETGPLLCKSRRSSRVILDMRYVQCMDACSIQGLAEALHSSYIEPTRIIFCIGSNAIFKAFQQGGIIDLCGTGSFFDSMENVLEFAV